MIRRLNRGGPLGAALVSLILAEILLFATGLGDHQVAMFAGLGVAVALDLFGRWAFRRAIGREPGSFLLFALGGMIVRGFVLILFVLTVLIYAPVLLEPFLIGLLTAYVIGIWGEIGWLVARTSRPGSGG